MPTQNGYLTVDAVTGRIGAIGLLPVIVVDDLAHARPLAQALVDSGLHTAEVTFRTPQALDALAVFAGHPELLVGAGTVRTAEQVRRAQDAGAQFGMVPGDAMRAGDWGGVTTLCRQAVERVAQLRGGTA
jgi:2-dehydro-3-deoxyphosphogluconate aldolase/(4S)-4-hydroxy-2-oxoglutarate aldolase